MDYPQVVQLIEGELVRLLAQRSGCERTYLAGVAQSVGRELDSRGLLVIGAARRWRVRVDDPGAVQVYEYDDIVACTAQAAALQAARRVIREDPGATIPSARDTLTAVQRAHMADADAEGGLVEAVARFAIAEEITNEEKD